MLKKFVSTHRLLLLILLAAALLRFIGTSPGYPPIHTDEGITHYQGLAIILNKSFNPVHNDTATKFVYLVYPILVPVMNALFYLFVFIPIYTLTYLIFHVDDLPRLLQANPDQIWSIISINIFGPSKINVVFWGRYVTALFGTGVVLMTYLAGKQLFRSTSIGLLASLFVAVNYRQVLNSHIGLPDIYNAFFLLLAIFCIYRLLDQPKRLNYLLTGVTVALSFSTKFFFYIFPPLVLIIIYQFYKLEKRITFVEIVKFLLKSNYLLMFGVTLGVIMAFGIYQVIYLPQTLDQLNYLSLRNKVDTNSLNVFAISYLYHIIFGPPLFILIILGFVIGLFRRFFITCFLLSILLPFFWFMLYYSQAGSSTRNFVTVTPLMLFFSAYAIYSIWYFLARYSKLLSIFFVAFILAVTLVNPVKNSIIVPLEYSKPWNYKEVQLWLSKNIPRKAVVLTDASMVLPQKNLQIVKAKSIEDYSLSQLQKNGIEWVVLDADWFSGNFLWWMQVDKKNGFKYWLKPTDLMLNDPIAKVILKLKDYIVFEALNPWQAPDHNYLVIKVPSKLKTDDPQPINSKFNLEKHLFPNSNGGM